MALDRRELLKGLVLSATTGALAGATTPACAGENLPDTAAATPERPWEIIDTNIHLFQWPFRRLPFDTTDDLIAKLQSLQITQAWAGSFEGVLHRDIGGVNARLAEACHSAPKDLLIPFGSVNPALPDWEEDLRRCHETFGMPGIRLHPNYHDYTLSDPRFQRLLAMAAQRGLWVQIAVTLEDVRTQHFMLQVPEVELTPLPDLMTSISGAKVMLLNYRPPATLAERLAQSPGIFFDTARVESTDGIARLMRGISADRVVFGSHSPLLIMEAALIKVYESQLSETDISRLLSQNAARMTTRIR